MIDAALCTVVTKSHIAYARALAESYRAHHPDAPIYVLLLDRREADPETRREPFEFVEIADLDIPNASRFCFQYDAFELSCAAKSYLLRYLVDRRGVSKLVYLDSDMMVVREFSELRALLDEHSIILTPHLIRSFDEDGRKPGERHIHESGIYNAGFIAVRDDASSRQFIQWLSHRVYRQCLADPALGPFVDQGWLDFVPGMFDGVHVLRHPGYNVGHWALSHRTIERRGIDVFVDGQPLALFHFSGLSLERLEEISLHQDRFTLHDVPDLRQLFGDYRNRVRAAGYAETRGRPYGFGRFSNGVAIPSDVRRMYWELGDAAERFGDPFATSHRGSFWQWLNDDVRWGAGISRFWYRVYTRRPDVQRSYPDVFGTDRVGFLDWAGRHGRGELDIDDAFGPPAAGAVRSPRQSPIAPPNRPPGVNVAGHAMSEKGTGEALRATVRSLKAVAIPHVVVDFPDRTAANADRTILGFADHNPHPVNVIHVNPDGIPVFLDAFGSGFLRGKYNVGYWVWELPELPRVFHPSFAPLDEVWVPSNYCLEAVSKASPVPVVKIPYALPREGLATKGVDRRHFGIAADAFVFLFMFDVQSILERKNPRGLLSAFRRAFPNERDVRLVLKIAHGTFTTRTTRKDLGHDAEDSRVVIIDEVLARDEINSLIGLCDCYVSLHRSEGFGMTLAEAMALGKPAIATGYSGNVDFMTPLNSFLVDYDLVELERDYPPYPRGSVWADPHLDHAAELMRLVYEDRRRASEVGRRAARDILRYLSPDSVGATIAARLELIGERIHVPATPPTLPMRIALRLRRASRLLRVGPPPGL